MARLQTPEHSATWWRSPVKIEGVRLIPSNLFVQYNPFTFYYPHGHSTRERRSLPYIFMDVNARDVGAVAAFTERFGVLGDMSHPGWVQWAMKSSGVDRDRFTKTTASDERSYLQEIENCYRETLAGKPPDASLCVPLDLEDFALAQEDMRRVLAYARIAVDQKPSGEALTSVGFVPGRDAENARAAKAALQYLFALRLSMVRPRLEWDEQSAGWRTAWDIGSLEAAMYLMLLFDIQGPGHILTCPRCQIRFLGDHPRTVFCSPRCQNADKVRRFRVKNSNKTKKGLRHGKKRR